MLEGGDGNQPAVQIAHPSGDQQIKGRLKFLRDAVAVIQLVSIPSKRVLLDQPQERSPGIDLAAMRPGQAHDDFRRAGRRVISVFVWLDIWPASNEAGFFFLRDAPARAALAPQRKQVRA